MPLPNLFPLSRRKAVEGTAFLRAEINKDLVRWARLMDEQFHIPGTSMRFGLDGILGIVPGLGDAATLLVGYWMLQESERLGVPRHQQAVMVANYVLDFVGGLVPVIGDVFDIAFKANKRNLELLQKHVDEVNRQTTPMEPLVVPAG